MLPPPQRTSVCALLAVLLVPRHVSCLSGPFFHVQVASLLAALTATAQVASPVSVAMPGAQAVPFLGRPKLVPWPPVIVPKQQFSCLHQYHTHNCNMNGQFDMTTVPDAFNGTNGDVASVAAGFM